MLIPSSPRSPSPAKTDQRPTLRGLLMAVGAGCMYGAWALWANLGHGSAAGWRAAGTQFFVSFGVTLVITTLMEWVHAGPPSSARRVWSAIAAAVGVSGAFTVALHVAGGTPEILNTVAPVLALGSLYCMAYVANLERELRRDISVHKIP